MNFITILGAFAALQAVRGLVTYCLGWKSENAAFVLADSAVTSDQDAVTSISSFGESQGKFEIGSVAQGALKLFRLGKVCYTFSGSTSVGIPLRETLRRALQAGYHPVAAFDSAIKSHTPLSDGVTLQCGIAFYDSEPKLFVFDSGQGPNISEVDEFQLGSLGSEHRKISADVIEALVSNDVSTMAILGSLIATVQSYGFHYGLMEAGVGGHISGCFTDADGFFWQPDIMFLPYNSHDADYISPAVLTAVRDDVFVVSSAISNDTRCFTHRMTPDQEAEFRENRLPEIEQVKASGRVAWVIFLDKVYWKFIIVEMRGNDSHKHLKMRKREGVAEFVCSNTLAKKMYSDIGGNVMGAEYLVFEEGEPDA